MLADADFWKWFDPYGNAASVVSFFIALAALAISVSSIVLQWLTRSAVNEARREVERIQGESRRQVADSLRRVSLQILGTQVELALRYNREARTAGEGGRWLRAKDLFGDAKHLLVGIAGNRQLTPNEVRGIRAAVDDLGIIDRMIASEKRRRGATRSFSDPIVRKLNEIDGTLGDIRNRIVNASLEVPNV